MTSSSTAVACDCVAAITQATRAIRELRLTSNTRAQIPLTAQQATLDMDKDAMKLIASINATCAHQSKCYETKTANDCEQAHIAYIKLLNRIVQYGPLRVPLVEANVLAALVQIFSHARDMLLRFPAFTVFMNLVTEMDSDLEAALAKHTSEIEAMLRCAWIQNRQPLLWENAITSLMHLLHIRYDFRTDRYMVDSEHINTNPTNSANPIVLPPVSSASASSVSAPSSASTTSSLTASTSTSSSASSSSAPKKRAQLVSAQLLVELKPYLEKFAALGEQNEEEEEEEEDEEKKEEKESKAEKKVIAKESKAESKEKVDRDQQDFAYCPEEAMLRHCQAILCKIDNKPMPTIIVDDFANEAAADDQFLLYGGAEEEEDGVMAQVMQDSMRSFQAEQAKKSGGKS